MKTVGIEDIKLPESINDAQRERVVITRDGRPIAILVGVDGYDSEQLSNSSSDELWKLISARRKQPSLTRAELERCLDLAAKAH